MSSPASFGDPRLPTRFWAKVRINDGTGCWEWVAFRYAGYGRFHYRGRPQKSHRVAYVALIGEIPDGLELDHLCRNPPCCNPAHLEPVTRSENILRGLRPLRETSKTHCPKGHPYDEQNTYLKPETVNGRRHRGCRACERDRIVRSRAERRSLREL